MPHAYRKHSLATRFHRRVDKQFAVMRYLVSLLLPHLVSYDEGRAIVNTQPSRHFASVYLHQLLSLCWGVIVHGDGNVSCPKCHGRKQ